MAEQETQIVSIREDFYRDSIGKVVLIILGTCVGIGLLVMVSLYLYLNKPQPIAFNVGDEWRVQAPVPLDQPYLSTPDLLQWVSDVVQKIFVFDFYHYTDQLEGISQYFTEQGWRIFLNQLNIYVNYNTVQTNKMFGNAVPSSAPYPLQQGLLSGRYAWWVRMPITLNQTGLNRSSVRILNLQILVVRVPTLNNLDGVGIDNIIITPGTENQGTGT